MTAKPAPAHEVPLSPEEALSRHGARTQHGQMTTNGELRFRLAFPDGSGYIRTQASNSASGWQNAHKHRRVRETYIVEKGWMGYAELCDGLLVLKRFEAGDGLTTEPGVVHNVYMPAGSVTHTVKHGAGSAEKDWLGAADCDDVAMLTRLHGTDWGGPGD